MSNYSSIMDSPMSHSSYLGVAVALGIIGVSGFIMNFMVIVIIIKDSQTLWTPINVIILNLVVRFTFSFKTLFILHLYLLSCKLESRKKLKW